MNNILTEEVYRRFGPILEHKDLPSIANPWKRRAVTQVLYNTERELAEERAAMGDRRFLYENPIPANQMAGSSSTASDGAIDIFDPILINLLRRSMPNMISYDVMGVQPMT